jgi:hypothetical protein
VVVLAVVLTTCIAHAAGAFQVTPAVPEAGMIAAMEDAVGRPGETVSAEAVPYNITCTGRASGGRGPAH